MKVLIIDDHAPFRDGLSYVLHELDEQVSIVEAPDFERATQQLEAHPDLDLVLLDPHVPGKDGFTVQHSIIQTQPATPVIILSTSNQLSDVQHAMDGGAMGYLPKDSASAVILKALRRVLSGGIFVPEYAVHEETYVVSTA